jgi:hypothetical protein
VREGNLPPDPVDSRHRNELAFLAGALHVHGQADGGTGAARLQLRQDPHRHGEIKHVRQRASTHHAVTLGCTARRGKPDHQLAVVALHQ